MTYPGQYAGVEMSMRFAATALAIPRPAFWAGGVRVTSVRRVCNRVGKPCFFISPTSACHPAARRVSISFAMPRCNPDEAATHHPHQTAARTTITNTTLPILPNTLLTPAIAQL